MRDIHLLCSYEFRSPFIAAIISLFDFYIVKLNLKDSYIIMTVTTSNKTTLWNISIHGAYVVQEIIKTITH